VRHPMKKKDNFILLRRDRGGIGNEGNVGNTVRGEICTHGTGSQCMILSMSNRIERVSKMGA